MNSKKVLVLLVALIVYVNYVMHFKKDVTKIEKQIVAIEQRIVKEERLTKEKDKYKDINSTKDYKHLFYNGKKLSYSEAMGAFQQDIQASAKEAKCTILNTRWLDMPMNNDRWYELLSLKISLSCTPVQFIDFQNHSRKKSKLFVFNQLNLYKDRRKNLLRISVTATAYRSKKNEK